MRFGLNSMTGFGRGTVEHGGYVVTVEVSSVNRKQFDLRMNAPRSLAVLEPQVGKEVRKVVARGGVTVALYLTPAAGGAGLPLLDAACARAYVDAARELARSCVVPEGLSAGDLLRLPGVMLVSGGGELDSETAWPGVLKGLRLALDGFGAMRQAEGKVLVRDMGKRLRAMRRLKARVQQQAPQVAQHYRAVLQKRLESLDGVAFDAALQESIAREVALFADRSDISEELVRLDSHFDQCASQLASEGPSGRTLEFLCQEMLREINTIGSKANHARIASLVVELKSELEALREQVQNVE